MSFSFGAKSHQKMVGLHPNLVKVLIRAVAISSQDFTVLEGLRTPNRQRELFGQGRSTAELAAKGVPADYSKPAMPVVTWTLNSNHFIQPDGSGHAVDLVPFPVDWNTLSKFDAIAAAMFQAAKELNVPIRWGADWDQDGKIRERGETDSPHFELVTQ